MERNVVRAKSCEGADGAGVGTGDVRRAQGIEGAVIRTRVNKGAVRKGHDTRGTTMSLRVTQGVVDEAHVARWNTIARECATES